MFRYDRNYGSRSLSRDPFGSTGSLAESFTSSEGSFGSQSSLNSVGVQGFGAPAYARYQPGPHPQRRSYMTPSENSAYFPQYAFLRREDFPGSFGQAATNPAANPPSLRLNLNPPTIGNLNPPTIGRSSAQSFAGSIFPLPNQSNFPRSLDPRVLMMEDMRLI
jgi:hypothetical protein